MPICKQTTELAHKTEHSKSRANQFLSFWPFQERLSSGWGRGLGTQLLGSIPSSATDLWGPWESQFIPTSQESWGLVCKARTKGLYIDNYTLNSSLWSRSTSRERHRGDHFSVSLFDLAGLGSCCVCSNVRVAHRKDLGESKSTLRLSSQLWKTRFSHLGVLSKAGVFVVGFWAGEERGWDALPDRRAEFSLSRTVEEASSLLPYTPSWCWKRHYKLYWLPMLLCVPKTYKGLIMTLCQQAGLGCAGIY